VPFEITPDLPPGLMPVAWLIGSWAGAGVVGYPSLEQDLHFGQEVDFSHDGRSFLEYRSRSWLLDEDGERTRPLENESGFLRVHADEGGRIEVEFLLAHARGIVEVFVGSAEGASLRLRTDVVARTATAQEYTAATRLYGSVEGDLLWAMDMAATGNPLGSHASARLKKVPVPSGHHP
jgi:hypothetical protein